jgi:hypothetical protein
VEPGAERVRGVVHLKQLRTVDSREQYLPIATRDIESWELNTNVASPPFINRSAPGPTGRGQSRRLAISTSPEIMSGTRSTWRAWRARPLLVIARLLLIPVVAIERAVAWAQEEFAPRESKASPDRARTREIVCRKPITLDLSCASRLTIMPPCGEV